jgi:hypothetical protein
MTTTINLMKKRTIVVMATIVTIETMLTMATIVTLATIYMTWCSIFIPIDKV